MYRILVFMAIVLTACKGVEKETNTTQPGVNNTDTAKKWYFPVTTYLKGQAKEIPERGLNPIKYVTANNHTDSSWLKIEAFQKEIAPFLTPEIDTANLTHVFSEKKFLDQTINAYTFTYDPISHLPDSFPLQHWDVYIDPVSGRISRIYMVKRTKDEKTEQLTWKSDKWCKIVTIGTGKDGNPVVEKEVLIKWDF